MTLGSMAGSGGGMPDSRSCRMRTAMMPTVISLVSSMLAPTAQRHSGLTDALAALQQGDMPVVWRPDRLGRSLAHLAF